MGAIKQVLGERKREKIAALSASRMEKAMMNESDDLTEETMDIIDEAVEGGKK
jgi:hypothetical protein